MFVLICSFTGKFAEIIEIWQLNAVLNLARTGIIIFILLFNCPHGSLCNLLITHLPGYNIMFSFSTETVNSLKENVLLVSLSSLSGPETRIYKISQDVFQ